jgi:hypothetical protein
LLVLGTNPLRKKKKTETVANTGSINTLSLQISFSYQHFKQRNESLILRAILKKKKMDEYLQYMKTLRSHMNGTFRITNLFTPFTSIWIPKLKTISDAEDQAAKISAEEQMQMTNIRTLENDIDSGQVRIRVEIFLLFHRFNNCLYSKSWN